MAAKTRKKPARLVKGSAAAKRHMAKIRAMRKGAKNPRHRVTRKTATKRPAARRRKNPSGVPNKKYQVRIITLSGKRFTRTVNAPSTGAARKRAIQLFRQKHPSAKWQTITVSAPGRKLGTLSRHEKDSMKISRRSKMPKSNPKKRNTRVRPGRPKRTVKKASAQASSPMYRTKPSQATRRKPSKRLMDRRARNTRPGTFPNPSPRGNLVFVVKPSGQVGYYDGKGGFDTSKANAVIYPNSKIAMQAARALREKIPVDIQIGAASRSATATELRKKAGY